MRFRKWIQGIRSGLSFRKKIAPQNTRELVTKSLDSQMLAFSKTMSHNHSGPVGNFAEMVLAKGMNANAFRRAGISIRELNERWVVNAQECASFGYSLEEIHRAGCFSKEQIHLAEKYLKEKRK